MGFFAFYDINIFPIIKGIIMGKVRVRYEDGTEEELVEVQERTGATINIYHQNSEGYFLVQLLPPHKKLEVHNLGNSTYLLGDRTALVVRYDYP
ncbi:hypothetical protein A1E70_RS01835 [Acinetobacter baumannii]|nr:hypothetical protein [Acinetobacter baumannii]